MAVVINYICDLIKEDNALRKEMNKIFMWCKRHRMTDNAAVIAACVVEILKYAVAIGVTAFISITTIIAFLLIV